MYVYYKSLCACYQGRPWQAQSLKKYCKQLRLVLLDHHAYITGLVESWRRAVFKNKLASPS